MAAEHQLTFGPFRLEMPQGGLWCGDQRLALRPRSLAMLRYLAAHPGRREAFRLGEFHQSASVPRSSRRTFITEKIRVMASSTMAIGIPTLTHDMSPEMSGALYEHFSPSVHV